MTRSDLPPVALSIDQAITTNRCTPATVNELRRLLGVPNDVLASSTYSGPKSNAKAQRDAGNPLSKTKTKATKPQSNIARGNELGILDSAALARLATSVANGSLKALTAAIREQSNAAKNSKDCQPLRPLSPNQQIDTTLSEKLKSNDKTTKLSYCSKDTTNHVIFLAECAQIAFEALRNETEPKDNPSKGPVGQIELGMSSLISKLLLLGMDSLAGKELRSLILRIRQRSSGSKTLRTKTASSRQTVAQSEVSLADLLSSDALPKDLRSLELMITAQVQVLKLLSKRPSAPSIERILHHLECDNGSILTAIETIVAQNSSETALKSSKWLDQIAQALDVLAGLHISPEAPQSLYHSTFRCRNLACRVRLRSWTLNSEGRSFQKHALDPFTSHLSTFAQKRNLMSPEKYMTISQGSRTFLKELQSVEEKVSPELYNITIAKSYRVLADVARENKNYNIAFDWLEKALQIPGISSCVLTALNCLLASTYIQQSMSGQPTDALSDVLRNVTKQLKQEMHGSTADMDDVLVSTASLRKHAVSMLVSATSSVTGNHVDYDSSVIGTCKEIVLCCARFFVRYSRSIVPHCKSQGERKNNRQLGLIAKSLVPTVEALAAATKISVNEETIAKNEELQCLRDCQSLIVDLDLNLDRLSSPQQKHRHPSITISNVFWCSYQEQKSQGSRYKELVHFLQQSIDALSACSPSDQETGFLFLKYEKLGGLLESNADFDGALSKYTDALQAILASPTALGVSRESDAFTIIALKPQTGSLARLRPLITSFLRVQGMLGMKSGREFLPFRPQLLSSTEGPILELQLTVALESLSADGGIAPAEFFRKVYNLLKESYAISPVPRTRVHFKLLHGLCIAPDSLPSEFANLLQEDFAALNSLLISHERLLRHSKDQNDVYRYILTRDLRNVTVPEIISVWHRESLSSKDSDKEENDLQSPEFVHLLQLLQKYLNSAGNEASLALVTDILMNLQQRATRGSDFIQCSAILGQQMTRLGHCELAQKSLFRAESLTGCITDVNRVAVLEWRLAHSEYLLEINNTEKCREMLASVENLHKSLWIPEGSAATTLWDRYQSLCYAAQIMHLGAGLSKAEGNSARALYYAKKSTRLIHRAWAILERYQQARASPENGPIAKRATVSGLDSASEAPPVTSTEHNSLQLAAFWKIGPLLYGHTARLAYLLTDEGQLLEAQYYSEKANKVAKAVGSLRLQAESLILRTYIARLANEGLSDLAHLQSSVKDPSGLCFTTNADVQLALAVALHKSEDYEGEISALKHTELLIEKSFQPLSKLWYPETSTVKDLDESMAALNINSQSSNKESRRTAKTCVQKPRMDPNHSRAPSKTNAVYKRDQQQGFMPLLRRQARRLRQSAALSVHLKDLPLAATILAESQAIISLPLDALDQDMCNLALSIRRAISVFANDPVFSLVQESSITCPSVSIIPNPRTAVSSPALTCGKSSRSTASAKAPSAKSESQNSHDEIVELLQASSQGLLRACMTTRVCPTTAMGHACSDSLFKAQLLLSVAASSVNRATVSPISPAYALEYGRCLAYEREQGSIQGDRLLDVEKDAEAVSCLNLSTKELSTSQIDIANFQSEYVDIIPSKWTVLSISVSTDHEELRISRFRACHTPLSLSIPLSRHNPRDCEDEEPFGFDEGKGELLEIVSLANYSAHEGVDLTKKGAKTAWWETRAALDARLKDLINNIQNMWIGGFRGIFSEHVPSVELLARFQTTLHNIMNKHLPSRQRTKKAAACPPVHLDIQILELFIGLGNPADHEDLDEALLDLFYFVVDILQFHGERNAYDEIDFDPMILETLEALTHYHNAVAEVLDSEGTNHTILILDKSLHAFPWESLPCLEEHSISRLPSLSCLRDRILMQQNQGQDVPVFTADANSGTYILNPGGDLASTHKTFGSKLSALTDWNAMVKSTPTESDITTALSTSSLYLYFGHGSGAQYVRSRAIRKLERCAVALLMGCSSGSLTEAGELESYGPLMAYLNAGSPAVVGTLWDVTDKDIDRFAMNSLERWGLFEAKTEAKEKGKARKTKGKAPTEQTPESKPVSLDEAVAKSRQSCILKYLNGAAPVVYGIPVMLK